MPTGDYASVVRRLRPGAIDPGDIVHMDGTVLGRHDGVINYTIGQRRGLGIGGRKDEDGQPDTDPLYVVKIEPERARVVVGPRAALATETVGIEELNWLGSPEEPAATDVIVQVKLRSTQPPALARMTRAAGTGSAQITLDEPQFGIAPGQAAVLYSEDGDRVLGGGWIRETVAAFTPATSGVGPSNHPV